MKSMKIVGIVHVDVDGATYATAARSAAEYHARSVGLKFSYGRTGSKPELEECENLPTLHMSMTTGLPNWGYTVWLVG